MSDERKIEFDIEAIVLAAVCVFLWLSLLSHHSADSVGGLPKFIESSLPLASETYPTNAQIANNCGWFGALISRLLLQSLGMGAYLVVAGLTVLTVWMFRVQTNYVRASRQIGWVLVVVAATTFASVLEIPFPNAPVIGPGGYLGAMTSTWLHEHFAIVGSVILTLALLLSGLLLSTDYVVVRALSRMLLGGAAVATTAASVTKKRVAIPAPGRRKLISDVEDGVVLPGEEGEEEESLPAIKIRRKDRAEQSEANESGAGEEAAQEESTQSGGLLGAAKALASRVVGSEQSEAEGTEDAVAEEELDDEIFEETEAEFREVAVEGELIQTRADEAHESAPEPKIKLPKDKKTKAAEVEEDSLAMLDDTRLPDGAEEYVLPSIDLLLESEDVDFERQAVEVRRKAKILEKTFKDFGFNVRVVEIETGPVIAQYEVELEAGLRLSKITGLADDLAIALRVPSVRIVAPIPGKNTVGIEVPNETRQVVRLREVIEEQSSKTKKSKIPLFLGKDVSGNALAADLASLPHLLIAGRTGTGKSVALNAIIASILMTKKPDEVRMLMIDPKMVELSGYGRLPHLMHPVVTDMKKAEAILAWAVDKMEERYSLLARAGVRHLTNYNELGREEILDRLKPETDEEAEAIPDHLPFIVIVADEMADLMMTAGKEVEQHIIRLAQKSRAVGIHLILATQKPTVDVITGLIKSNLPARISFQVASRTDSRVVLDEMGADKLLGNGDMLFLWPGTSMLLRGQGTYLSDEEINAVVDHCSTGEQNFVNELVNLKVKEEGDEDVVPGALKKRDELYSAAVDVVVREGRGSCSLLQRSLGIGYGRAARLIDYMAEDGIVGQYNGSQARDVLLSVADWETMQGGDSDEQAASPAPKPAPAKKARSNKVLPESPAPAVPNATAQQDSAGEKSAESDDDGVEYEDADYEGAEYDNAEYEDAEVEYEEEV
ncbi:MAG: DNA translocase FtsK [Aureliella sp.]